ncbi:hypothetical protein DFQ13_105196 [Actinokineospora spheciospongiae]|nr:hypothetical protein DFQ13_105196 [Actinokineospora spheciospongiae]
MDHLWPVSAGTTPATALPGHAHVPPVPAPALPAPSPQATPLPTATAADQPPPRTTRPSHHPANRPPSHPPPNTIGTAANQSPRTGHPATSHPNPTSAATHRPPHQPAARRANCPGGWMCCLVSRPPHQPPPQLRPCPGGWMCLAGGGDHVTACLGGGASFQPHPVTLEHMIAIGAPAKHIHPPGHTHEVPGLKQSTPTQAPQRKAGLSNTAKGSRPSPRHHSNRPGINARHAHGGAPDPVGQGHPRLRANPVSAADARQRRPPRPAPCGPRLARSRSR